MRTFFTFLLFLCFLNASATRRALLFGIGDQMDKSWAKIHGDNDLFYVRQLLMDAGFTDVVQLKNREATKQSMVRAFIDLANRCRKGDVVYIHYSGHGQLMTDLDGDEALRTTARHGRWDESWIPYDAYMNYGECDKGEKHFCDDEVDFYLTTIRERIGKKGKLIVVVDACHSGDATYGEEEEAVRGVGVAFDIPLNNNASSAVVKKEQWLSISACKPYQLSTELKDLNIGKLTYALYSIGKRLFAMDNEELQGLLDEYMEMNKGRFPQNPVVSGEK
ncbi:MAG: caspase family protein [Paraprevotella sp.]|nr:caspase family protein [Paraprevotella sp.]